METHRFLTIGHSTRSIPEFMGLLREAGANCVVDVRKMPRSRTNPQYNAESLAASLAAEGIAYRHVAQLGGLRSRRRTEGASPNSFWQHTNFRNYADYAGTAEYRQGYDELLALGRQHTCAVMCAEAVWWRCHRRIIADYLLSDGYPVFHILAPGKIDAAKMTPAASRQPDGTLLYVEDDAGTNA